MSADRFGDLVSELGGLAETDAFAQLCAWSAHDLEVSGAGLSLIIDGDHRGSLGASNDVAAEIEELQFRTGEGPCIEAHRTGALVSEPDLAHSGRWPLFAPDATARGIGSIYAIPMQVGSARLGALDLYCEAPHTLTPATLDSAYLVTDIATALVLGFQADAPNGLSQLIEDLFEHRVVVHQATGMVSVQLGVGLTDALVAIRGHAYATDRTVRAVASDVVDRHLRLDP